MPLVEFVFFRESGRTSERRSGKSGTMNSIHAWFGNEVYGALLQKSQGIQRVFEKFRVILQGIGRLRKTGDCQNIDIPRT
jgi:hypothetical protein